MFDGLCVTHVFLDEVQATVVGHEGSNLLSVLNQLNTSALSNSRVRLLGLNATAIERPKREWEMRSARIINEQQKAYAFTYARVKNAH